MGRMRKLSKEQREAERVRLYDDLEAGRIGIPEAVRRMRVVAGMSRQEYARRVARISPSALAKIERGEGNPQLDTLRALGAAFGLEVGFVRRRTADPHYPARHPPEETS